MGKWARIYKSIASNIGIAILDSRVYVVMLQRSVQKGFGEGGQWVPEE